MLKNNSIFSRIIAKIIVLTIILSNYTSCEINKKETNINKLTTINLFHVWELVKLDDGQFIKVTDTLTIFYYKNLILYEVPFMFESSNLIVDKYISTLNKELIQSEKRYNYFVYEKGDSSGFKYDSLNAQLSERFSVDSFLIKKAFKNAKFYNSINDSLVETIKDVNNNNFLEKYIPKLKLNDSFCDSAYLYFTDKMINIDYSFSKDLDSIKNSKLFKIRLLYNPILKSPYAFDVPKRELLFELKFAHVTYEKEIIKLLEKFKNDKLNQ